MLHGALRLRQSVADWIVNSWAREKHWNECGGNLRFDVGNLIYGRDSFFKLLIWLICRLVGNSRNFAALLFLETNEFIFLRHKVFEFSVFSHGWLMFRFTSCENVPVILIIIATRQSWQKNTWKLGDCPGTTLISTYSWNFFNYQFDIFWASDIYHLSPKGKARLHWHSSYR
jgi:hypothetical protein